MNLPFSLPSASKYTVASVFKDRIRKAYWYKGCSRLFSLLWQRDFSNTSKSSVVRWLLRKYPFISRKRKAERKQELLRSQIWPGYVEMEGEKRKMTDRLSYSNAASKKRRGKKKDSLAPVLHVWEYKNIGIKTRAKCPIWYKLEKLSFRMKRNTTNG